MQVIKYSSAWTMLSGAQSNEPILKVSEQKLNRRNKKNGRNNYSDP